MQTIYYGKGKSIQLYSSTLPVTFEHRISFFQNKRWKALTLFILVGPSCPDEEDRRRTHCWHCILQPRLDEFLVVVVRHPPFADRHRTVDQGCFGKMKKKEEKTEKIHELDWIIPKRHRLFHQGRQALQWNTYYPIGIPPWKEPAPIIPIAP